MATCSSSFTSRTPGLGNGEISLRVAMFSSFSTVVIYPAPAATGFSVRARRGCFGASASDRLHQRLERERREVGGNAQVHLPDGLIPGLRRECEVPDDLNVPEIAFQR